MRFKEDGEELRGVHRLGQKIPTHGMALRFDVGSLVIGDDEGGISALLEN